MLLMLCPGIHRRAQFAPRPCTRLTEPLPRSTRNGDRDRVRACGPTEYNLAICRLGVEPGRNLDSIHPVQASVKARILNIRVLLDPFFSIDLWNW